MEAAVALEVDRTYVTHLARGRRVPARRLANRIEQLSAGWPEGPIRPAEWDEAEDVLRARRDRSTERRTPTAQGIPVGAHPEC